jgi:hypothetical protein
MLDMVRFTPDQRIIGETEGLIVEVDVMGTVITSFPVSYPGCCSLNHDVFRHDGNYYSQFQDIIGGTTVDPTVIINDAGVEIGRFDPRDHGIVPASARGDYFHQNTVFVATNGDLLLSWLYRDSVARVNGDLSSPDFGEVLWIMDGNPPDDLNALAPRVTIDWSDVGGDDNFDGQHDFKQLPDGRYMLMDNANGRVVVFTIDEKALTAHADAVYAAPSTCGAQGTAQMTAGGNVLAACYDFELYEYDGATGVRVWEGEVDCRTTEAEDWWSAVASVRWYPLDTW